jgi:hypothetical protein
LRPREVCFFAFLAMVFLSVEPKDNDSFAPAVPSGRNQALQWSLSFFCGVASCVARHR